ncbi:MAG: transcription-repair coupling factor [Prevotella sp.]|nr:transcription-repair coupling factor [Prevotella sp.]
MTINDLLSSYAASQQAVGLVKSLEKKSIKTMFLEGLIASSAPLLFASIFKKCRQPFLFILQDAEEAGYFYHDLTQLLGNGQVLYFPSSYRRAFKYGHRDAANEILRTEVLARLAALKSSEGTPLFVVTSPEGLCERVVGKRQMDDSRLSLHVGQQTGLMDVETRLRELGFSEVDYVYEPGQFAVRGSIVDVYSFSSEYPFRIDFFGDEIDTIRTFGVEDQLSKERKERIEIVPELAVMVSERVPFMRFLPKETVVVLKDFVYVHDTIEQIYQDGISSQVLTERMDELPEMERKELMEAMRRENSLLSGMQFSEEMVSFRRIEFGHQPTGVPQATLRFDIVAQPLFHKNMELLRQTLNEELLEKGYTICLLTDQAKQAQRLRDILGDDLPFQPLEKTLHEGFIDRTLRLCLFTDHQIFDRYHKYSLRSDAARSGKMALTMKELQEIELGDFLVHVDYGVGKFGGLVRIPIPALAGSGKEGGYQEVIRLVFQRGDIADVSIHSLYKISKYRRSDTGEPPRLSTLGTGAWERMKERTKQRIKDIARDLIKLYARRQHEKGFSFSADSFMQHELEAGFLYEDTPDQLKATAEVKADMESVRPMDRLICGDVGFGKTEVAVRAAFKAACDSKQVAVLVPTTVLCFQHFQTFSERLKGFPVRVDYLSRARSAKQTKQLLQDLKEGKIDILVGTHKLIGKSVEWKDLGLLIIDEEQKFGVAVKEKLRKMKTNIDTLTLTATPIPRTLQFSLMGARDMSIMRTPPPNRYPIYTELATYGHEVIADAVNFEMSRNGQVFFVSARINTLQEIEQTIRKYVPDCRIAIGHGQMKPEQLEKIILGFINYDYDVLLSTTIVENGIDIPNANTIIINDAHRFGLSDLHQMRGRVGRSNRKAFCYLLAPPKSLLKPEARRRLEALETFSELGSGFNLAMQDLDLRGAGNLLGAEQSGFMEDLGYETYQKILNQAVTELKNEEFGSLYAEEIAQGRDVKGDEFVDDCSVESDLEMYFPDDYVPGSNERILLYRELDSITSDETLNAYRKRLEDRFGPMPEEGEELLQVVALRRLGRGLGAEKIFLRQGRMSLQFVSNAASPFYQSAAFGKLLQYVGVNPRRCNLKEVKGRRLMIVVNVATVSEAVAVLREIEG